MFDRRLRYEYYEHPSHSQRIRDRAADAFLGIPLLSIDYSTWSEILFLTYHDYQNNRSYLSLLTIPTAENSICV